LIALIEHLARVFGDPPYWDVGLRLPNIEDPPVAPRKAGGSAP
jgi:hypothetical protein